MTGGEKKTDNPSKSGKKGGKSIIIAGIDPGSIKTGVSIVEVSRRQISIIYHGTIKTPQRHPFPERLLAMHEKLKDFLVKFKPVEAGIEDIFYHKNARTAFKLGQARGVILLTLASENVKIFSYPPAEIKKAVATYGAAGKLQIRKMIRQIYCLNYLPSSDEADALAVAYTHALECRLRL